MHPLVNGVWLRLAAMSKDGGTSARAAAKSNEGEDVLEDGAIFTGAGST